MASALLVRQTHSITAGTIETRVRGVSVPTEAWLTAAKSLHVSVNPETSSLPWTAELPDQMTLFESAGIGMSKEETCRTYMAMQRLQEKYDLKMVRFFGKVFGTTADYLIIEACLNPSAHKPPSTVGATPPEMPGIGLNAGTYFVAPSAVEEFVQLEDVTPEAMLAAMKIRKYFTGNLDAPVSCYPAFPGNEATYLRAQIARIAQATAVKPANALMVDEASEETPKPLIANPEYTAPDALPAAESWVHAYGGILTIGRCTNVPKVVSEGDEDGEAEELEEEVDPLKLISEDPPVATFGQEEGNELTAWTTKMYNTEIAQYAVAIAKSNRWPGAYTAIAKSGDKSSCVYFGWGQECAGQSFTLESFPPVAIESAATDEAADVAVESENALFKEIDEAKLAASNTEYEATEA